MAAQPTDTELIGDAGQDQTQETRARVERHPHRVLLSVVVVALLGLAGWGAYIGRRADVTPPGGPEPTGDTTADGTLASEPSPEAAVAVESIPEQLRAAELFVTAPDRSRLHALFEAIGGFEGLRVARAHGAFDVVGFDPADPDRLLAAKRLSYGPAQNQLVNEEWRIDGTETVDQRLWAAETEHDFAHFNADGTITTWIHGGGTGYASRIAVVGDSAGARMLTTAPMYASRFTATARAVFALTDNGDYGTNQIGYVDLIADDGTGPVVLDDGEPYDWIDNPTPDLLVAYPVEEGGATAVWDTAKLEPVPTHPLAGRDLRRVAVSGDRRTAIGATPDGSLEVIDLTTGADRGRFGHGIDVGGVDRPITIDHDGRVAITVERSGLVRIWWVGDDDPIATYQADAAQPRWISTEYAPQSTSVVAPGATRVALRIGARPGTPVTWDIIDTGITDWIERACRLAGRTLSDEEAKALGLLQPELAC